MRIVIPTTGSLGDVQPFVALGRGLQAAGHRVCVATHSDFAPFVRAQGLDFFPLAGSARALHETEAGTRMINAGNNPFTFLRHYARLRQPLLVGVMTRCWQAGREADLIIASTTAFLAAYSVAEKLQVPLVAAHCLPVTPNRLLASSLFPQAPAWLPGGGVYNLLTHLVSGECMWQSLRRGINRARQEVLGLPPFPFLGPSPRLFLRIPTLYGYSPLILPRPREWDDLHHVTGYWFLDSTPDWRPPPGLIDFLEAGPPPVVVGFGSMHNRDAEAVTALVRRALARCKQRGVLLTGWGGLESARTSDQVFATQAVPHDWLFPRTAAVVHHGGAGTTAAGLRAGVPTVVVPFMADQPFWGRQVFRLGVGPRPVPRRRLAEESLASAILRAVSDTAMRQRARDLGERIRAEDGVAQAVQAVHCHTAAPACRPQQEPRQFKYLPRRKPRFFPQGIPLPG